MNIKKLELFILALALIPVLNSCKGKDWNLKEATTQVYYGDDHSAFPSITKFNGKYYISFREAGSHIFDEDGIARGKVRIMVSRNGKKWETAAVIVKEGIDLRDPKLSVTPDNRLMVVIGGSYFIDNKPSGQITHPYVSFSTDGKAYTAPVRATVSGNVDEKTSWIWRVTWQGGTGYGVSYGDQGLVLLSTTDGLTYNVVNRFDDIPNFPNESTVRFLDDGRMAIIIRRDGEKDNNGILAVAEAPFNHWKYTDIGFRIGGPDMLIEKDGSILLSGRKYTDKGTTTTIWKASSTDGPFEEVMDLHDIGPYDCSYTGIIRDKGNLLATWYKTYGKKKGDAAIYFVKIPAGKL